MPSMTKTKSKKDKKEKTIAEAKPAPVGKERPTLRVGTPKPLNPTQDQSQGKMGASKNDTVAESQSAPKGDADMTSEELRRIVDSVNDVSEGMEVTSQDRQAAKELQEQTAKISLAEAKTTKIDTPLTHKMPKVADQVVYVGPKDVKAVADAAYHGAKAGTDAALAEASLEMYSKLRIISQAKNTDLVITTDCVSGFLSMFLRSIGISAKIMHKDTAVSTYGKYVEAKSIDWLRFADLDQQQFHDAGMKVQIEEAVEAFAGTAKDILEKVQRTEKRHEQLAWQMLGGGRGDEGIELHRLAMQRSQRRLPQSEEKFDKPASPALKLAMGKSQEMDRHSNAEGTKAVRESKHPKLDVPQPKKFDGKTKTHDVRLWLRTIERYLEVKEYDKSQWGRLAFLFVEADALVIWDTELQTLEQQKVPVTWEKFCEVMKVFFGSQIPLREAQLKFMSCVQQDTVQDFVKRQRALCKVLQGTKFDPSESVIVHFFIQGLAPEPKHFVNENAPYGWYQLPSQMYDKALQWEMNHRMGDVTEVEPRLHYTQKTGNKKSQWKTKPNGKSAGIQKRWAARNGKKDDTGAKSAAEGKQASLAANRKREQDDEEEILKVLQESGICFKCRKGKHLAKHCPLNKGKA